MQWLHLSAAGLQIWWLEWGELGEGGTAMTGVDECPV